MSMRLLLLGVVVAISGGEVLGGPQAGPPTGAQAGTGASNGNQLRVGEAPTSDAAELERGERVATHVGAAFQAFEEAFRAQGDPLAEEGAEAILGEEGRGAAEVEPGDKSQWVVGAPARPIVLERSPVAPLELDPESGVLELTEDLRAGFGAVRSALGGPGTRPAEVKVKAVAPVGARVDRTWAVEVWSRHVRRVPGQEATQVTMRWQSFWSYEEATPKLVGVRGAPTESVQLSADPDAAGFVDVTDSVFESPAKFWLIPSIPELRGRFDLDVGVGILGHHGVTVTDMNGDGIDDIYLCQPGGLPNQLWIRRPDGSAIEAAAAAGLDLIDATTSALAVDFDGDGDRDLVLGLGSGVLILSLTPTGYVETGRFERSGITGLAAADVDGDRRIDLYACAYANPYEGGTFPVPYHDAENGQGNMLLRNITEGQDRVTFADETLARGLDVGAGRFSFAATFEDVDEDGDADLYVANDFGRNALYFNDGAGRFEERARAAGVEDLGAGMGAAFGDFDGDLKVDLYVANMQSSAGRRVTGLPGFLQGAGDAARDLLRRHAKGNTMFLGRGLGSFRETAEASAGQWAWGALPIDLDGNGALDVFVPNGFVSGEQKGRPDL